MHFSIGVVVHFSISIYNYIIEKFEYGIISVQCLSDIFRLALINNKGGVWIDATIFLCKDLPKDFVTNPFYTCHTINGAKWTGFLMGGQKNNIVIQSVYELMLQYWKKGNRLIDYFLLDYLIEVVYRNIPEARILINTIPDNNMEILFFIHHGNQTCEEKKYQQLTNNNYAFKLTWKRALNIRHNSFGDRLITDLNKK